MDQEDQVFNRLISENAFLRDERHLLANAFKLAKEKHKGQFRKSGEPYVCHTLETGILLAEIGMNATTIAAGILHDILEDTDVTESLLKKQMGAEVTFLVKGVTKLEDIRYHGFERHIKSLQRLFVSNAKDSRVIIIKLCDRLHNMMTLQHLPPEKRKRIAEETLYVFVPVAERLGIWYIKEKLADLSFKHLHPKKYKEVEQMIAEEKADGEIYLDFIKSEIKKKVSGKSLLLITSRVKGIYSLYKKLERKKGKEVYDILAVTVVVRTVAQCYETMGIIHTLWHPLSERIKDYVALPKPNGYQSLHTSVLVEGKIVEIQIRTMEMHEMAQYGVASHYSYKYNKSDFLKKLPRPFHYLITPKEIDKKDTPEWLKELGTMFEGLNEGTENTSLEERITDQFSGSIFAYTPKRDVIELSSGATALDFAYNVHTELGNYAKSVYVNGKLVPLKTELKNGDIVEIKTAKNLSVNKKWLDFVKLKEVRRKIQHELKLLGK